MDNSKLNPHAGHRQRMRKQFLAEGRLDSFPEHKILEMLLFYSTPRADTNALAHELINTFGSINGVFDAPYEALTSVKGMGEHSAVLIKMIPELVRAYQKNKTANAKYILNSDECVEYLRHYFETIKNEALIMICLNNAGKILRTSVISEGAADFTVVDTRKIIQETIFSNATQVILAHNHPGGLCAPSRADIDVTREISKLLRSVRARLANHLIVCDGDYFSFAANEKFSYLFIEENPDTYENPIASEVNIFDGDY